MLASTAAMMSAGGVAMEEPRSSGIGSGVGASVGLGMVGGSVGY